MSQNSDVALFQCSPCDGRLVDSVRAQPQFGQHAGQIVGDFPSGGEVPGALFV